MNESCPICGLADVMASSPGRVECVTCGHEWTLDGGSDGESDGIGEVRDAFGNLLQNGDSVTLVKDLKLKGTSSTLKIGTKVKGIRLVAGDHQVDCKVDGRGILLKAEFLKKA